MIELVIAMLITLIVAAIAIPSFMQGYQNYKLNQGASQVQGILKSARFQAIRQNNQTTLRTAASAAGTTVWCDSDNNGAVGAGETQFTLGGSVVLVAAGSVPNTAGLATAVNTGVLTAFPIAGGALTFDVRGATVPAAVSALYLDNTAAPLAGYRALVVMPSGAMQEWTADTAGNWSQVN